MQFLILTKASVGKTFYQVYLYNNGPQKIKNSKNKRFLKRKKGKVNCINLEHFKVEFCNFTEKNLKV